MANLIADIDSGMVAKLDSLFTEGNFCASFKVMPPSAGYISTIPIHALGAYSRYGLMHATAILSQELS